MNALKTQAVRLFVVCGMSLLLPMNLHAWEPGAKDLDAAISAGDFAGYFANISAWLSQKVPADPGKISEAAAKALLKDPVFANTLDQRQFISKLGVDKLGAFAKADPANREFLAGLLKNTQVMDMFLEAVGPTPITEREANTYAVPVETLDTWRQILNADPDSKSGIYQKLAIATAIAAPHIRPSEPMGRYNLYKSAHKNKELFPSFDNLTVWEYTKVVSVHESDRDITWAREMINTWRPDLRIKEQVVESTREVWRRNSPHPYTDMPSVLEGGGKCGPRSRWAVFVCQAFGIPAIGVGQPSHACVAAKTAYPEMQPQPGSAWKVHQGAGWQVSKLDGTSGPLFLEAVEERSHTAEFSQIEHLRWLASTLAAKEAAEAVRAVADKIRESAPVPEPAPAPAPAPAIPEEPFKAVPGTIHVEAETFTNSFAEPAYPEGCVYVHDCFTGGKQLYFQKNMKGGWVDYSIDVPESGTYGIVMRAAAVNVDQVLDISSGENKLATINIPNTTGLWTTTQAVDIKLKQGTQILRISAPFQRGVALRWFELKSKATNQ